MKDGPSIFPIVPHQDETLSYHLEAGYLPDKSFLLSVIGNFLRTDEELGWSREVVDILNFECVNFAIIVFKFQDYCAYTLGFD